MIFRSITPEDYKDVREFLAANGWEQRVSDFDRFAQMMENTNRTVIAVEGSRIVGFARALCDEVSNGYISMVAVSSDQRGRGIGRELVRQIIGDDPRITWVLRTRDDSRGFWERVGFQSSGVAMEKIRA
jgi:ribosomal protein S18 acetylase RimI-like enzyme